MTRKERYSKENFEKAIKSTTSIKDALKNLGLRAAGGNYKVFHKYVEVHNIDTSHFETKEDIYKKSLGANAIKRKKSISEILIENSDFDRTHLKKRLYDEGLKERFCEMKDCGQGEVWMGKKMSLILDHINGVYNDNRIENLRIVCANCNATLPTHCGKHNKKEKVQKTCIDCGGDISKSAVRCNVCSNKNKGYIGPKKNTNPNWRTEPKLNKRIVQRPPHSQLQQEISEFGYSATGRKYGVSDNAVRKWLKSYETSK